MGVVQEFLDDCRLRNLRDSTVAQKRRCLHRLEVAWGHPLHLGTEQLRAHISRPMQPESRATELAHLRSFYKWCVLNGKRNDDPTLPLKRPKVPRRLPRPISEADLEVAVGCAPERVRPMLMLAAFAGLRAKEIAGVRGQDVQWEMDPPVLVVEEQKGGDIGSVPLPPVLADMLAGMPRSGWLFPRRDGVKGPLEPHMVSKLCNDHLHSLGISHTLHTLRHRYGTQVYRASGRDLRLTQELLRHRSPVSTAIYTWCDPSEGYQVVSALPHVGLAILLLLIRECVT